MLYMFDVWCRRCRRCRGWNCHSLWVSPTCYFHWRNPYIQWQQTKSKISSYMFTFLSAAIWFDFGDIPTAGGDSKRSPRSAHGRSRFISAAIWFDLGDSLAAGGDSKRSPRSAHGCSRFISAAIWFDLEDIPPAGGDSRRSPRSAHGCSRFYPLQFWFDLGWLSCFWWWQHR